MIIAHRINTIELLKSTPVYFGVELDLHAYGERLIVHHDAFSDGLDFERWLDHYRHAFVILNIKEEGIETRVRDLVVERGIVDFMLLDLSFPALMKMTAVGEKRVAVRVSEYEPWSGAVMLANRVAWTWLDAFHGFPLNKAEMAALKGAGLKTCLVSPELHGRDVATISSMRHHMIERGIDVDAICTKRPDLWTNFASTSRL